MALPLQKLTGPTVATATNLYVPSGASTVDETILAPAINRIIDELNALGAKVAALAPSQPPVVGVVVPITADQEAAIVALPLGSTFTLEGQTARFTVRVDG